MKPQPSWPELPSDHPAVGRLPSVANTPLEVESLLPFSYLRSSPGPRRETVHFFLYDYQFERTWNSSAYWAGQLQRANGAFSPDFSVLVGMPEYMQFWQVARSRALMAYWQSCGIRVVPTLQWADEDTFEWCFDGLDHCDQVAVSSVGCLSDAEAIRLFALGFEAAMRRISPQQVLWYGRPVPGIDDRRIRYFQPFQGRFEHGRKREGG